MWGRITISSIIVVSSSPAFAADGRDSLMRVFDYNPSIAGERSRAKAAAIELYIAKADRRFDFRIDATAERQDISTAARHLSTTTATVSATVSLPIWSGGRVSARIAAAGARADVARAELVEATNRVLTDAMIAHIDVARDRTLLRLQQEQTHILAQTVMAAELRAQAQEVTDTDVQQAKTRLAISQARVSQAEASLISSSQQYWAITGAEPDGDEQIDDRLPPLPQPSDIGNLLASMPSMMAERHRVQASLADLQFARATVRPTVNLFARYDRQFGGATLPDYLGRNTMSVGITMRLPLYQGGRPGAEVRARRALLEQSRERQVAIERTILSVIRARYAQLMAADETMRESKIAIDASEQALKFAAEQHLYGERTLLDVLNASQELLRAQTRLVDSRRDRVAIAYEILALFGQLVPLVEQLRHRTHVAANNESSRRAALLKLDANGLWQAQGLEHWQLYSQKT